MKKQLLCLLGATLFFAACKKDDSPAPVDDTYVPDNSFKIVAYMPSYRDPATVADQKYKMITHLFYAFLNPTTNADGSLQPLAQQGRFATVKAKAKANKVKFGISIGPGTGVTEDTYLTIAKSATARGNFVKILSLLLKTMTLTA